MKYEFYAGSYGKKEEESIVKFSLDGETGQIERIYGWKGVENPSWLLLNAGEDMLYAVENWSRKEGYVPLPWRKKDCDL